MIDINELIYTKDSKVKLKVLEEVPLETLILANRQFKNEKNLKSLQEVNKLLYEKLKMQGFFKQKEQREKNCVFKKSV